MSIIEAIILGIVQGITEFLPVSSSGHLVLLQRILGISEPALLFDILLHVGTLAAVFIVLWQDIWAILKKPVQRLTGLLLAATIPTAVIALLFKDFLEAAFHSGVFLGFAFLCTAITLVTAEFLAGRRGKTKTETSMAWGDAIIIGTLQGAALLPGVSRSGLTLSGALSRKLDRSFAAKFSFLLSIPAILGALVFQLKDVFIDKVPVSSGIGAPAMIAGTLAAAAVGVFAIRFMLKIVKERSLKGFAVYTGILGIAVLADQYLFHLFF